MTGDPLLRLAEDSNADTPLAPGEERIETGRYVIWLGLDRGPQWTAVQRLRLAADEIESTVAEVRALLAERGRPASIWEVSSSATPADLGERLLALGMQADDEPLALAMVLTEEPPPAPRAIEVRQAETVEDFLQAQRIAYAAFGMPQEPDPARARTAFAFEGRKTFLACLDGEPVGAGTATPAEAGVVLNGGSVLPHARGRGAYRALVRGRWDEAVRRGTPALVTQAGRMSRPILLRLGFREVARIHMYRDEP